ncbi:MAG: ribosome small subunit-dependent GTPase A [Dehalococcoidia bacterium]|nr:ribosome small subunit-dependent GTPase A [Dehalococcoidia bacterium]
MDLRDLGFDEWFREKATELPKPDCKPARVTAVNRENYLVRNEKTEVAAELTGAFRFSAGSSLDLPAVGDWVLVQYQNAGTFAIIRGLLPRKTILRRKTPGRDIDYQIIAANIDMAFIVQACDSDFNLRRLDRYLVMAREGGIQSMLLLTKSDLVSPEELEQRIAAVKQSSADCRVIVLSNKTGFGLDAVREVLEKGKTYCLIGSSGVGKSTLLNRLMGRDLLETNTVRTTDGKGRHTTARRQLIVLDQGAMVIDTPGMRELGNIGLGEGIDESFPDITELSNRCRFTNCTHTNEPGCALLAAVRNGELSEERYQSYLKLLRESEYHEMSYLEKRRKDRKFGQFVNKAIKQHDKRKSP